MGVKGLWKLIECSGVPVPLETLEHKILSVDVSIWLHQAVRGFRGPGGAAVANAHLITLFHRICKLLFYRIRPVFVFDGGVPHLKKQTLASRRLRRDVAASKAKQVRERLLSNLLKSQAVRNALGRTGPGPSSVHVVRPKKIEKDMFELPPLPEEGNDLIKSEPDEDQKSIVKDYKLPNLHQFELEGEDFKALPLESQHEILCELQITRKENSWNTLNMMPQESTSFAEFQMGRLMKRRKFQSTLDDIRQEMQKKKAAEMEEEMFGELEKHVSLTQPIVSEDSAHSVFIKRIKDSQKEDDVEKSVFKQDDYKGKAPMKRKREDFERDFLTELEKQGIVKTRRSSVSDSDSDIDDDDYRFTAPGVSDDDNQSEDKLNFDGQALLKVVNSLLDNEGLSQDEILALIKQDNSHETTSETSGEIDGPSTSGKAPGFVFNPDVDSSDDDSDFIEVSEPGSPSVILEEKIEVNSPSKDDSSMDNVKKVLETKNSSLWIKIMQQKLDDVVHMNNIKTSPKKALVDSRSMEAAKQGNIRSDNEKPKILSISLNFDAAPLRMEDDIFADVFTDICDDEAPDLKPTVENKKPRSNLDAITRKMARYSDLQEKQLSASKASNVKFNLPTSKKSDLSNIDVQAGGRLQLPVQSSIAGTSAGAERLEKIKELQKFRIETKVKEASEVVELMSSSDDSDSELERKEEAHNIIPIISRKWKVVPAQGSSTASLFELDDEDAVDDVVEIMSFSDDSNSDGSAGDSAKEPREDAVVIETVSDPEETVSVKDSEEYSSVSKNVKDTKENSMVSKAANHTGDRNDAVNNARELQFDASTVENDGDSDGVAVSVKSPKEVKVDDMPVEAGSSISNHMDVDVEEIDVEKASSELKRKDIDEKGEKEEVIKGKTTVEFVENGDVAEVERSQLPLNKQPEKDSVEDQTDEENVESIERPLDYSEDELKCLEGELANEQRALVAQAQKIERVSTNLNDQMYGESQHLLQLFGIPYLVAPMEAEAQCAYLDAINLTAGTITDDSDVFLFGGTKVYKHFFNQTRHVEFFKTDNISANLGLNRDKMITLALLTGSDYTEGIESVGAVSGMEVLTEFPGEGIDCLRALRKWWNVAHKSVSATYFTKVKQKMAQVHLPESFPSESIFKAYLEPEVDESRERFSWAVPNVNALREFTMEKFGWNRAKADEILLPVMKKLGVKSTQMRIDSFFTTVKLVKDSQVHSKRMQDAIAKAKGEEPPSAKENALFKRPGNPVRKTTPAKKRKTERPEESVGENAEEDETNEEILVKKPSRTLLIDPSESRSGPEVTKEKPKAKATRKKKEGQEMSGGPGRAMREDDVEFLPPRKLTKEIMFEALHKKQTISQRETDKQMMEEKKKMAAELLKITAAKGKKR